MTKAYHILALENVLGAVGQLEPNQITAFLRRSFNGRNSAINFQRLLTMITDFISTIVDVFVKTECVVFQHCVQYTPFSEITKVNLNARHVGYL